jgi:hypothetical protein
MILHIHLLCFLTTVQGSGEEHDLKKSLLILMITAAINMATSITIAMQQPREMGTSITMQAQFGQVLNGLLRPRLGQTCLRLLGRLYRPMTLRDLLRHLLRHRSLQMLSLRQYNAALPRAFSEAFVILGSVLMGQSHGWLHAWLMLQILLYKNLQIFVMQ